MFKQPAHCGMSGLVKGNYFLFLWRNNLVFLFKTSDNAVYGIQEVLFFDGLLVFTRGDQCLFVAHVCDVRTGETRGLAGEEFDINVISQFEGFQVYFKNLFALIELGQVDVYDPIKSARAH